MNNYFDNMELSLSLPEKKCASTSAKYTKCMKNHAASIGGNAVDGCGEFVVAGPEGLTCGACGCHMNFHRKVDVNFEQKPQVSLPLYQLYPLETEQKKRYRTKFTSEQKEKMIEFAEMVGWRLQKADEEAVEQFCRESGVSRRVFKVWMHNNKSTLAKRSLS